MTCSVHNLICICLTFGLKLESRKTCEIYTGYTNSKYCRIVIHKHILGKDIPDGTYKGYIKELGLRTDKEFREYLDKIC